MEGFELMKHEPEAVLVRPTTSSGRCDQPVVCRPAEAIDCFLHTKMDVLVLGDVVVARS
jgi:predicted NodU family carbamoyl transferase